MSNIIIQNLIQEIMHWYCAIRAAKIKLMKETFPERSEELVSMQLKSEFQYHYYFTISSLPSIADSTESH